MRGNYRRWADVDADGSIRRTVVTGSTLKAPYIRLSDEDSDAIEADARPFRYDRESGRFERLPEVRLVVSGTRLRADGKSRASVTLRDATHPVEVRINGQHVELEPGEVTLIGPTESLGEWRIELADPRVWAEEDHFVITAVPPPAELEDLPA